MIRETEQYRKSCLQLPTDVLKVLSEKIALLEGNSAHPSLKAHRITRRRNAWEAAITRRYRVIYLWVDGAIELIDIGNHSLIDKVHIGRRQGSRR
ncbi:MAG: hypothetical protein ACJ788_01925 [Ktedonobacteraceae bacterium]